MRDYTSLYVNGNWSKPSGGTVIDVINPATEKAAGQITLATPADVDRAVAAARAAFADFSRTTRQQRLDLLGNILGVYARRHQDLADALTEELGAPQKFAKEIQAGVGFLHLQTAIATLQTYAFEHPQGSRTTIRREPIGVVGMITPWNWPINQVMVKVVAALATGCTMVHKPSEIAPFTAHVLAEIFHEAGVPKGVYNLVDGDGPVVGAAIAGHRGIDMVSFTGSTAAGIDVAKRAADNVKRVHTELGGKSPNIILQGADFGPAIASNIYRLMLNSGQTCHAPTRLLVPMAQMAAAKATAKKYAEEISVGDPTTDVYMGPVISKRQWDRIQSLIRAGIHDGATLVTGGLGHPDGLNVGYYVRPTVFAE
jgi:aldehyde dehydrogenase (NAD+)